jgi:arsenate reductase-like glutaredoxin family protein
LDFCQNQGKFTEIQIMESSAIKEKLHHYINNSDEKLLHLMYALAKEYNDGSISDYEFTNEELAEFEERRKKRLNGESKTYNWSDAKRMITGK